MTNEELEKRIKKCKIKKGKELVKDFAYLCMSDEFEIIVLTTNRKRKVGGIVRWGDFDIHFTIFPKYRGQHFLSNFLKTGVMQEIWNENKTITLYDRAIESMDDYYKKMHLVELTGYTLTNTEEIEKRLKFIKKYYKN